MTYTLAQMAKIYITQWKEENMFPLSTSQDSFPPGCAPDVSEAVPTAEHCRGAGTGTVAF